MAIADLDFSLITKRKRMMDSVGHYARPDLLQLYINMDARTSMVEGRHREKEDSSGDLLQTLDVHTNEQTTVDCRTTVPRAESN